MCFIFTYISWLIDLIQRIWTFLMSFCIAIAICSVFLIACVAGIAFGYNYSMFEFLTFNKSQLSVTYLRNIPSDKTVDIFWDEIENQRNNNKPLNNVFKKLTKNNEPELIALDVDDILKKENMTSFEDENLEKILSKYPSGSVNQMKAVLNHIYSEKFKKLSKSFESTTTEASTEDYVTLFSEYDDSELMHWRRIAQNMRYANRIESREAVPAVSRIKQKYLKHITTRIPKIRNNSTVRTFANTRPILNTTYSFNKTITRKPSHHTKTFESTRSISKKISKEYDKPVLVGNYTS